MPKKMSIVIHHAVKNTPPDANIYPPLTKCKDRATKVARSYVAPNSKHLAGCFLQRGVTLNME